MAWQPVESSVAALCALLRSYQQPGVDHSAIVHQLQAAQQAPDFANYLAYTLCQGEGGAIDVRQVAGLLLKNHLRQATAIPPASLDYVKSQLVLTIGAADPGVRKTVGSAISTLLEMGSVAGWPEILEATVRCLDSGDYNHIEGAMDALSKVCEDSPQQLDDEVPGLAEKPLTVFLPRFLQLFHSPHVHLRRLAITSVLYFVPLMPQALEAHLPHYLAALFHLTSDSAPVVRKAVCTSLVQLLEIRPDILQPHLNGVIQFMMMANQEEEEELALEACEFWTAACEMEVPLEVFRPFMPHIVQILLKNMEYAEVDEAVVDAEEDDSVPDREENLRPRFHKSKGQGATDEEEEDEDASFNVWNLRKCSAAGLDLFSARFGAEMLLWIQPHLQKIRTGHETSWKEREAAVLALGAVADGCMDALRPSIADVALTLLPLLEDPQPLVRSISCWTLSRFSGPIAEGAGEGAGAGGAGKSGEMLFDSVLVGLLTRILDRNKRVQEAACSAFATMEEAASSELTSRLEPILSCLMSAFPRYQRANLRILYDAIGTLADAVGADLQPSAHTDVLMPPLIAKWHHTPDWDRDLFPLLECLTSIAQALGPCFSPYAEPVFQRCLNLIRMHLVAKSDGGRSGVVYDREFIVCSLDLLSGLNEGLGSGIESLVSKSDLAPLLLLCCQDESLDVRQSALALLGDTAKNSLLHLLPHLPAFQEVVSTQMVALDALGSDQVSVTNNACWALGEMAVKIKGRIAPVVPKVTDVLYRLLQEGLPLHASLVENAAITWGRLGWACPDTCAPMLDRFMTPWCRALTAIRDDIEKEEAFRGLCAMIRLNPAAGAASFLPLCSAIGSWHEIRTPDLKNEVAQVLKAYKQMLGEATWAQHMAALDPSLRDQLVNKYGI